MPGSQELERVPRCPALFLGLDSVTQPALRSLLMGSSLEQRGHGEGQFTSRAPDSGQAVLPQTSTKDELPCEGRLGACGKPSLWGITDECTLSCNGVLVVPGRKKALKDATTHKLFPRTRLFVAPSCCISSGSECSSPTMVGPTSCKGSHRSCLAGCWAEGGR